MITAWCDGSGSSSGGPGGVGYVAEVDGLKIEGSFPLPSATNQQAEILAAAYALSELDPSEQVLVWSDSEYVVKGWGWLPGWIARGWRVASGGQVKNQAHWRRLLVAAERHERVEFRWCRGHSGVWGNERADQLAELARLDAIGRVNGLEVGAEEMIESERFRRPRA